MTFSKMPERRGRQFIAPAIALAAVLIALAVGPRTDALAQEAAPDTTTLHRVTLIVSDIERSMDFYQRLGLVSKSDTSRTSDDVSGIISADALPLTDDPTRSRLVIMSGEGRVSGAIALLWYDRPPLPSARGNLMGLGTGDMVLMFEVPDIQGVYSRLGSASTRFHEPPTRFTEREGEGALISGRRLLAYDPDGHMVEIIQLD